MDTVSLLKNATMDAQKRKGTPMDELIGLNTFIDDPIGRIEAAGFVREYHSWGMGRRQSPKRLRTIIQTVKIAWNPGAVEWNFDLFYQNLHQSNITVSPVLQGQCTVVVAAQLL